MLDAHRRLAADHRGGLAKQAEQLALAAAAGDVALQVRAPGFDVLERLRSRLSESGLAVQLGSASRDGSTVSARLVIGG
nr:GspL/Epsl periplasmic domain-containing protein [Pseudomonas aeruginosa]